jgi:hypothetical protein
VRIRPDTEWQTQMSVGQKRLVTALTWPLLLSYGYVGRKAAVPTSPAEMTRPGPGSTETERVVG